MDNLRRENEDSSDYETDDDDKDKVLFFSDSIFILTKIGTNNNLHKNEYNNNFNVLH